MLRNSRVTVTFPKIESAYISNESNHPPRRTGIDAVLPSCRRRGGSLVAPCPGEDRCLPGFQPVESSIKNIAERFQDSRAVLIKDVPFCYSEPCCFAIEKYISILPAWSHIWGADNSCRSVQGIASRMHRLHARLLWAQQSTDYMQVSNYTRVHTCKEKERGGRSRYTVCLALGQFFPQSYESIMSDDLGESNF